MKRLTLNEEIKNIKNKGKDKNKDKKKERNSGINLFINNYDEEENYIYFQFDNFINYYINHLKNYIAREQEDDKESFAGR